MIVNRVRSIALLSGLIIMSAAHSVSLPEDQADVLVHSYDDADVQIRSLKLGARKQFGTRLSLQAHTGKENIEDATPDILTIGTPFSDTRNTWDAGLYWLQSNMLLNLRYETAAEDDTDAAALALDLTSSLYSEMTTLRLGFGRGNDTLRRSDDAEFNAEAAHRYYRFGVTQVLSQRSVMEATYTAALDSGYLGNPYRYARLLGVWVPEQVPTTRNAHAVTWGVRHYLYDHAAVHGAYRYNRDTWGLRAHTLEATFRQDWNPRWGSELRYRFYTQTQASFYSDDFSQEYNYYSRDKSLSDMRSHAFGVSTRWHLLSSSVERLIEHANIELSYDYVTFEYSNYTDIRNGAQYAPAAHVFHINLSIGY